MKLEFLFSAFKPPHQEAPQAQYIGLIVILFIVSVYYIFTGLMRFIRLKLDEMRGQIFTQPVQRTRSITYQGRFNAVVTNTNRNDAPVTQKSAEETTKILRQSSIPLKDILDIVECMVCLETISVPFSMCLKGHLVCNNCVKEINNCPTCREPIGKTVPICVKQLIECIPNLCSIPGCEKLVRLNGNHEKYCKKRNIVCHQRLCNQRVLACDWINHKETDHQGTFEVREDNSGVLKWPNFKSSVNLSEHILFFRFFNGLYSLEILKLGTLLKITFRVVFSDNDKPECCFAVVETEKNGLTFNCTLKASMTEEASDECTPSIELSQKYISQFLNLGGELSLKYEIKPKQ